MELPGVIQSILTSLWIISTALAVQFRASGKAQRKALRRLRDRDIEWSIYAHELRQKLSSATGKHPPEYPPALLVDHDELEI